MNLDSAGFQLMLISLIIELLKVLDKGLAGTFQCGYVVGGELGSACFLHQVPILKKDFSVVVWKVGYQSRAPYVQKKALYFDAVQERHELVLLGAVPIHVGTCSRVSLSPLSIDCHCFGANCHGFARGAKVRPFHSFIKCFGMLWFMQCIVSTGKLRGKWRVGISRRTEARLIPDSRRSSAW